MPSSAIGSASVMEAAAARSLKDGLAAIAARLLGAGACVTALERLSGGASQELWSMTMRNGGVTRDLVMRRNPGGVARAISVSMETEARLMGVARLAGAPVPAIVHVLSPGDGLGTGFVMERIEGESLAPRILREPAYAEARTHLARQLGKAAARIHGIAAVSLPEISARQRLAEAEAAYRAQNVARPVVEWALRWLYDALPKQEVPLTVVHGDFRHGNIMVGPEGLRAVLDWEAVHLGDPMEDLGWACVTSWRFGRIEHPVGGFGSREDFFAGYQSSGRTVDATRVRFWEVMGTLRWGLTCGMMTEEFRSLDGSVEKAAIGRRFSETAIDLLAMLAPPEGYDHA